MASSRASVPVAGAVTTSISVGSGEEGGRVAALGPHHGPPGVHGPAVGQGVGRVGVDQPDELEHLAGEGERELDDVGRTAAGQDLDGLHHLEGVAGRAPERHVHLREQRHGADAVGAAEPDHHLGQLARLADRPS